MQTNPNKPRVFTRDNPCTKVELWNCFQRKGGFRMVSVVEAKTLIGENAPKYMLKKGYIREATLAGVDLYRVSISGEEWLREGIRRYLELHPERLPEVDGKPPGIARSATTRKGPKMAPMARQRPAPRPPATPTSARRLTRSR